MSDNVAIKVEGLSKKYTLRHRRQSGDGLRHRLQDFFTSPFQRWARPPGERRAGSALSAGAGRNAAEEAPEEEFWALRDVSFEVKRGEIVGIIGRNGAGKSTLLKILSRITEPASGRITLDGHVASLLEVGTGFHPELTGRENIFLNGAILGMTRAEIKARFDEIVAFAEVEKFLDTAVKRYSSGMYVRLAFAVAAHLEPEILIIDEVLAVGDAEFQKKCLGKISAVSKGGRTVLFVSHQMNAIRNLCTRAILLHAGRVVADGPTHSVIDEYLGSGLQGAAVWTAPGSALADPAFAIRKFAAVDRSMKPIDRPVPAGEQIGVLIEGEVEVPNPMLTVGFALCDEQDQLLWWSLQTDTPREAWPVLTGGSNRLVAWLPPRLLNEGAYRIDLIVSIHFQKWIAQPSINAPSVRFEIRGDLSESPLWIERRPGALAPTVPFHKIPG